MFFQPRKMKRFFTSGRPPFINNSHFFRYFAVPLKSIAVHDHQKRKHLAVGN